MQLKEQLARAQKLLKNSLKRDYYKILGLPRNAQEDTIQKVCLPATRQVAGHGCFGPAHIFCTQLPCPALRFLTARQAYRKLAREWHPDKFSDPAEKETAAKKFMDIASAKEVR